MGRPKIALLGHCLETLPATEIPPAIEILLSMKIRRTIPVELSFHLDPLLPRSSVEAGVPV
jgi:hypothetical protein